MDDVGFKLVKVTNPFDRRTRIETAVPLVGPIMPRLADLIAQECPSTNVTVSVDGLVVPRSQWLTTHVLPGQVVVVVPVVEGGGDDGKQVWGAIAMISMAIVGGVLGGLIGGALFTAGSPWIGVMIGIGAGVFSLAGGLIISALTPVMSPEHPDLASSQASSAFGWNPKTTQSVGLPIPFWYGRNKVHGNIISVYTEPAGADNKQVLNMVVALGRGPIKSISDIRINDQPIESFQS